MTIESCDMEMIYCLKEIEPELHQITPFLLPSSQILYLLTLTMNKRYMEKLKLHVIHLQRIGWNTLIYRRAIISK